MTTIGDLRFGLGGRARSIAREAFPELAELLSQFAVVQVAKALARDDNDVPADQAVLIQAERFADLTFQAIAFNGELDALLADHQTQAGMIKIVVARE